MILFTFKLHGVHAPFNALPRPCRALQVELAILDFQDTCYLCVALIVFVAVNGAIKLA